MNKLRTSYILPGTADPPAWDGSQPFWLPVAFVFQPEIYCSELITSNKCSCGRIPVIPWDHNIAEIWVQSRKAFEVLNLLPRPDDKNPLVRIFPPPIPKIQNPKDRLLDVLVAVRTPSERHLGYKIIEQVGGCLHAGHPMLGLFQEARVVVFPFDASDCLDHLAWALSAGCKIVSSDAGAAEEFLCCSAAPGAWHVIHTQSKDAGYYVEAIKDLMNQPAELAQVWYKDEVINANPKR